MTIVNAVTGLISRDYQLIAFYDNLYERMGILGELPEYKMIAKLKQKVAEWNAVENREGVNLGKYINL